MTPIFPGPLFGWTREQLFPDQHKDACLVRGQSWVERVRTGVD
jgi:hypothetical protein